MFEKWSIAEIYLPAVRFLFNWINSHNFFGKRRTSSAPYLLILYSVFFCNDSIGIFMRYPCLKIMSVFIFWKQEICVTNFKLSKYIEISQTRAIHVNQVCSPELKVKHLLDHIVWLCVIFYFISVTKTDRNKSKYHNNVQMVKNVSSYLGIMYMLYIKKKIMWICIILMSDRVMCIYVKT